MTEIIEMLKTVLSVIGELIKDIPVMLGLVVDAVKTIMVVATTILDPYLLFIVSTIIDIAIIYKVLGREG